MSLLTMTYKLVDSGLTSSNAEGIIQLMQASFLFNISIATAVFFTFLALYMAARIIQIFESDQQCVGVIQRHRSEWMAKLGSCPTTAVWFDGLLVQICSNITNLSVAPKVMGISIRPTLVNVLKGYIVTAVVAVAGKVADIF